MLVLPAAHDAACTAEPEGQWLSESVVNSLFKGGPSELLRPDDPENPDAATEAATVRVSLVTNLHVSAAWPWLLYVDWQSTHSQ